ETEEVPVMKANVFASLLAPILVMLVPDASVAQSCRAGDGLDGGPCGDATTVVLPDFPGFRQDALFICWKDCAPDLLLTQTPRWKVPVPASAPRIPAISSVYTSDVTITDAGGSPTWSGRLFLWYSRTWGAFGAGTRFQIWRFLVNGDLAPQPLAGTPPCPVPS